MATSTTHPAQEHHRQAADHHKEAAKHHESAAQHYAEGKHETAAEHAHHAHGHTTHARHHADEAAKAHATHEQVGGYTALSRQTAPGELAWRCLCVAQQARAPFEQGKEQEHRCVSKW